MVVHTEAATATWPKRMRRSDDMHQGRRISMEVFSNENPQLYNAKHQNGHHLAWILRHFGYIYTTKLR